MTINQEKLQEALAYVKHHNDWRKGADIKMCDPRELSIALDLIMEAAQKYAELLPTLIELHEAGEKCETYAKVKIEGKLYCKRHAMLRLWDMLLVSKTHELVEVQK